MFLLNLPYSRDGQNSRMDEPVRMLKTKKRDHPLIIQLVRGLSIYYIKSAFLFPFRLVVQSQDGIE